MSAASAIRVHGLGKRFLREGTGSASRWRLLAPTRADNYFWALRNLTFEVPRGEGLGIVGRNGAGKSTLLKVISRVLEPTEGEVALYGRLNSLLEIGTGFQADLSGRDNIYLNASILGMSRAEVREVFDAIVDFSGLREFIDMPVKHYSSGMYSRLAFSVAAHVPGDILALDEVLSVGDAEFRSKCQARMAQMIGSDRTVLFVSHSMDAILRFCTTAIWLDRGQLRAHGPAGEVVKEYLRSASRLNSAVNLTCAAEAGRGEHADRGAETADPAPAKEHRAKGEALRGARFTAVALSRSDGTRDDVFSRHERICIDLEYEIFRESPQLHCVLHVHCAPRKGVPDEVHLFTATTRAGIQAATVGRFVTRAAIPEDLLTTGQYSVSVALVTPARPLIRHEKLERVVSFRVVDEKGADGQFMLDALHGVIYPRIVWQAFAKDTAVQEVDS